MNICVAGLWHLGSVTAACLAAAGHNVVGLDGDAGTIADLNDGRPPVSEPRLAEWIASNLREGRLRFTTDAADALRGAEIVWITYDTPVDDDDNADVAFVLRSVEALLPQMRDGVLVLISSQLPVGSTRTLEQAASGRNISFACLPENLRLGKAIDVFTHPDRVIAGVRSQRDKERIAELLAPLTDRIEWMSAESAEMTKHALNAFLATSVAFMNEIAAICEHAGADAKEVERGLKSEQRIGPKAYLGPGSAFAGGTLARDVVFLSQLGEKSGVPTHVVSGVKKSNDEHRGWAARRLRELLGDLDGKRIAIWGLTYKPGTDTLRRSSAVELCQWLLTQEATVVAHDPAVKALPDGLHSVQLCDDALAAARGADALVVMTEWPEYLNIAGDAIRAALRGRHVLDANRFLARQLGARTDIVYVTVGKAV